MNEIHPPPSTPAAARCKVTLGMIVEFEPMLTKVLER